MWVFNQQLSLVANREYCGHLNGYFVLPPQFSHLSQHHGPRILGATPPGPFEVVEADNDMSRSAIRCFSQLHLSHLEALASDPWVYTTLSQHYNLQF
ncbi:hypothetical protein N1851_006395 [Merluccius polli]|uniref:Uncharacterized protein n=1 Tax=Merluccius polli TaxID=89951 RepID=A0AA47P9G3_MERPO|nr:hypothetical protein N1851_006395 [Merluccius polli]